MIRVLVIAAVAGALAGLASMVMWRASQRSTTAAVLLGGLFVALAAAGALVIAYLMTRASLGP